MCAHTTESVSTYLVNFSILVRPPRNPNDDDDNDEFASRRGSIAS
jgi:hypothetical protein